MSASAMPRADPAAACPECAASRHVGHPAGSLVFSHAAGCSVGRAQDATAVADAERTAMASAVFVRPATAAERELLVACGVGVDPSSPLSTRVSWVAGRSAVMARTWAHVAPDA